jgi:hypothetical protein
MFQVCRIYSDASGHTHFEDVAITLKDMGTIGSLSDPIGVKSIVFREVEPSYDWDFHPAPQRQYIVLLDGEIEIETSLHEKRIFKGGDILLVEDVSGKGHKTKNLKAIKRKSIFITLP